MEMTDNEFAKETERQWQAGYKAAKNQMEAENARLRAENGELYSAKASLHADVRLIAAERDSLKLQVDELKHLLEVDRHALAQCHAIIHEDICTGQKCVLECVISDPTLNRKPTEKPKCEHRRSGRPFGGALTCSDCGEVIEKRSQEPPKKCEHVWEVDGDRDVCKKCGTRANPVM